MKPYELFSRRSALIIGLVMMLAAVYAILVNTWQLYATFTTSQFQSGLLLGVLAALFLVFPVLLYLGTTYRWAVVTHVILVNILFLVFYVFYVGSYSIFVFLWLVPQTMTLLYCGWRAGWASALLILPVTAVFVAFTLPMYTRATGLGSVMIILVGTTIMTMTLAAMGTVQYAISYISQRNTRLKAAQQAEKVQLNRLNTLLNSISDAVLTLNRYGRITSQNAAALSFFDTNQSLVNKNIDEIISVKDAAMKPVSIRKLGENIKKTLIRDDVSMEDSAGGIMRLSIQLSPIHGTFEEDESGCVAIIRDITRQKTLEDEKDEFISVTSHELRTPITIAEGSLSNLAFMFEKKVEQSKLKAAAETAHDQVLYLARMINDLSTLSRAERGVGDKTEEIDLNVMLQELYLRYQPEAEAKSLKLNIDLEKLPALTTSRLYLEEILQNFLTNAIKYTKKGSVTLIGKLTKDGIRFAVSDTGIGISKADQEKVFEKFFRSEDYRTRETSGTGLGLYVVAKLAAKLGTAVEIESRLNHGSTFGFTLPIPKQRASPDEQKPASLPEV